MGSSLRSHLRTGNGLGRDRIDNTEASKSLSSQSAVPFYLESQISLPDTPDALSSAKSRQSSSELSSEIAQEIIVWTEDMDIDSDSQGQSGLSSPASPDETSQPGDDPTPLDDAGHGALLSLGSSLSTLTDLSDLSSLPSSSAASKATTPVGADDVSPISPAVHQDVPVKSARLQSYHHELERLTFTTRPKSSIPTDIPLYQYASECITAAESSRLNPYALHPEEYHLLRYHISHSQVTTYLNIRNGILRLWLRHPWNGVTRQQAVGFANARWFDAASVCYDWLVRRGYINYGCVHIPEPASRSCESSQLRKGKTVAVIGAGISGLGCARQLECLFKQYADRFYERGEEPPSVVVLEGRGRVGGRVYSREFKTKPTRPQPGFAGKRHTAEMGGMIITGFDRGNPMNILVRGQLGIPYHALTADTTIYDSNGKPVDPVRDQLVEKLYNDCLDRVSEFKHKSQPSKMIEGNRDLIDDGKDSNGDGGKTIIQAEEAAAALPHAPPVSQQNVPEQINMVPVASDKITGRVYNLPGVPATFKASDKAKLMGWDLRRGATDSNIDLTAAVSEQDATLGSVLDAAISQYKHLVDLTAQDHRLVNWHIANLEYSNATNLHNLSLGLWDIDAGNEWEGQHTMVVGGYQSVARGLLQCPAPLNLQARFPVSRIQYHGESVSGPATITSEDGATVPADAVVCTIPLGVLKQGNVVFEPPLSTRKQESIERLGFGILNKVVLVYNEAFWDTDRHIFGVLRDAPNRHSVVQEDYGVNRGRFFQWFNVSNTTGLPCLIALMAGDAGFETEHSSNDNLIAEATDILRSVFGNDVPYPVEAVVTRWGSDRFARGSYSSAAPGMQPDDYEAMAQSQGNLFFAGEHTIGTHPATVHGAYLSGLRAASEVLEALIGPIEVPTPLILPRDSLLLHKRKEAVKDPRQAQLDAHEAQVWEYIRSQIGDRPPPPTKVAGNAYLLFSKANFEVARKKCEETRKPGKARSLPNEVRVMTSRMWKDALPEERKPFEEQAAEQKQAFTEAMAGFNEAAAQWDRQAVALRAAYEKENPGFPGRAGEESGQSHKRRARNVSYTEDRESD